MKVLITGVAGFIGSHSANFLINLGYDIFGVDNFSSGTKENLKAFLKSTKFSFSNFDIKNKKKLFEFSKGAEIIIHLAAKKIPRYQNSLETLQDNTQMTQSVLEIAKLNKSKIIFASTSDVYGLNNNFPFKETSNLVMGPSNVSRWAYAVSKIFDEHICFAYSDKYKFPVVILRFFGVYGPGQNKTWWGGPFGPFIENILKMKPVEIHGTGYQIRCFTYIDDVVKSIHLSMVTKKAEGEIFNISSNEKISILNLARLIEKQIGIKVKKKFVPYKSFYGGKYQDIQVKIPHIEKAQKILNFKAKISLNDGLKKTIEWHNQNL